MTQFLQFIIALVIIILAAKVGGYLSYRLGQPGVLGELLVGILLGPTFIDLLHANYFSDPHLTESIHNLAELGVLLLMFLAGLELHLTDLAKTGRAAITAGVFGVVFPALLGLGLGLVFQYEVIPSFFLGITLSATSVSISAQTLIELKVLRSRVGISLLGAAVFDDILVVIALSVFLALTSQTQGWFSIVLILIQMLAYLAVVSAFGYWFLPLLSRKVSSLPVSQGLITFTFIILLTYGWLAETLGHMAAITGAFLAGVWLSRSPVKERIEAGISVIAYGIFVPIFFVNIGLVANIGSILTDQFLLLVSLFVVAALGKILGSGLGARLAGFSYRESLQLGVGMMSRGEVGLIVATVGVNEGFIGDELFAAIIGVIILTTLFTPPLLRYLFSPQKNKTQPTSPGSTEVLS